MAFQNKNDAEQRGNVRLRGGGTARGVRTFRLSELLMLETCVLFCAKVQKEQQGLGGGFSARI